MIDMFDTSVFRVQSRAADRRLGLLTVSVVAHTAIIVAIVAAGLASVKVPNQAPMQMTIPVFSHIPPALGTPNARPAVKPPTPRSEEHTSELQSHHELVCRLLLEKKKPVPA